MTIDITSFFFNSSIEDATATPAWGTSIGQSKSKNCRIEDDKPGVIEMLTGMLYKSISSKKDIDISAGSKSREILLCSLFDKIYVNNQQLKNQSFLSLLVREKSVSHDGRLLISYPPYARYKNIPVNQNTINAMSAQIGCSPNGCWFVHDISVKNQDELHFSAIIIDKNYPKIYKCKSKQRSEEWAALVNEVQGDPLNKKFEYRINPLQTIYFGSPGTGKSFYIKHYLLNEVPDDHIFRTTFHPDSDYASFVGTYKPIMKVIKFSVKTDLSIEELAALLNDEYTKSDKKVLTFHSFIFRYVDYFNGNIARFNIQYFLDLAKLSQNYNVEIKKIVNLHDWLSSSNYLNDDATIRYNFEPQVFTEAYVKAWNNPGEQIYLVIEEINRGNCAQIFGDLFQLLDRKGGVSEYPVKADAALANYLTYELTGDAAEGIKDGKLKLPANLNIVATMNTSDQSLFPIDSAFKRRWEWKYIPTISLETHDNTLELKFTERTTAIDGTIIEAGDYYYSWNDFLKAINKLITEATHSDDKQLGFWFVKTEENKKCISISNFVSKVIFYLWNDIFKDFGPKDINPFIYKAEGKNFIMPFSSFFEINSDGQAVENTGVLHTFMNNLNLEPNVLKDIQKTQDTQGMELHLKE